MRNAVNVWEGLSVILRILAIWAILIPIFTVRAQSYTQLEQELAQEESDSLRVLKTITLTRAMHRQDHQEQQEYQLAQHAVDLALVLNDTLLYARALDNMGLLYRYHQWYGQSLPLHIKAFELIEHKPVDPLYKMICANNAGLAARYDQQYAVSVSYYQKALRIAHQNKNTKNIGISSNGLGNALSNIPERKDEALGYFQSALKAEMDQGDSLGMAMNLLSVSDYYIEKEDYKEAFAYLDRLWEINEKRDDRFGMAITNEYYGHAFFKQGTDFDMASSYYHKALRQYQELKNEMKTADVLHSLGKVQFKFGRLNEALRFYNLSKQLADSLQSKSLMMDNAYGISKVKERQGQFAQALEFYQQGKVHEDSINLTRQNIRITALSKQYNLEKKESEIALLQKEKAAQNAEINTHRTYLVLLFIAVCITLLFVFIQFQNRKAKREAELKLRDKEQDLLQAEYERNLAQAEILIARMQVNPHFIFNCLNAINLLIQKQETKKASQYLVIFSRFIRMILEMPRSQTITLAEELELIRYYLTLEEKRFDRDFNFTIDSCSESSLSDVRIPPLLLQPFIENAIWHGLLPSNKPEKNLLIRIVPEERGVKISIDDNGVGRGRDSTNEHTKNKTSMGMKITRDRIDQFNKTYECKINLEVIDKELRSGTTVILHLSNMEEPSLI